ncbi:hypothetical protein QUB17_09815 [Microcoleus sp. B5-C4]
MQYFRPSGASHLCSPPLEIGVLRQEAGGRRQKERGRRKEPEGRSQKKYFYKYEMLPLHQTRFLRNFSMAYSPTIAFTAKATSENSRGLTQTARQHQLSSAVPISRARNTIQKVTGLAKY